MKQLKKFFETQKGCDEFEFRSTAGLIPLSAVAILCYAGLTIGLYIWGKYAIAWQNIVYVCFLFFSISTALITMTISASSFSWVSIFSLLSGSKPGRT